MQQGPIVPEERPCTACVRSERRKGPQGHTAGTRAGACQGGAGKSSPLPGIRQWERRLARKGTGGCRVPRTRPGMPSQRRARARALQEAERARANSAPDSSPVAPNSPSPGEASSRPDTPTVEPSRPLLPPPPPARNRKLGGNTKQLPLAR